MIEIALDEHNNNIFLNEKRPVYPIDSLTCNSLDDYRQEARKLISEYNKTRIIVVHDPNNGFSLNMFALALFIESCHIANDIDCVVFKVKDYNKSYQEYKPFVALTIAIKYIMRLCLEDVKRIYQEFTELGYLGLEIKHDYIKNQTIIRLNGNQPVYKISTHKTKDAIAAVGMLKALSLAKVGASVELEINEVMESETINETDIINKIVSDITPWIK